VDGHQLHRTVTKDHIYGFGIPSPLAYRCMQWHCQWRRPGAEFGGRKKFSWTKISEWRFFRKKISIFTPKNSDDLFL